MDKLTIGYYYLAVKTKHLRQSVCVNINRFGKQNIQYRKQITKRHVYMI